VVVNSLIAMKSHLLFIPALIMSVVGPAPAQPASPPPAVKEMVN